jgi:hypothetical protein
MPSPEYEGGVCGFDVWIILPLSWSSGFSNENIMYIYCMLRSLKWRYCVYLDRHNVFDIGITLTNNFQYKSRFAVGDIKDKNVQITDRTVLALNLQQY